MNIPILPANFCPAILRAYVPLGLGRMGGLRMGHTRKLAQLPIAKGIASAVN